jgi:site-specific DNA recombinase
MSPSHARKQGIRYRYYISTPLLQGQAESAGSIPRVSAAEIEAVVLQAVRDHLKDSVRTDDRDLISTHLIRVEVHADHLAVQLKAPTQRRAQADGQEPQPTSISKHRSSTAPKSDRRRPARHGSHGKQQDADDIDHAVLVVPWQKNPSKRRREIIMPISASPRDLRPIRAETRVALVTSIARGRRWLDEIVTGNVTSVEQIAARDKCSIRQVNMTISLAFLAPDLVKAAVEGRLPRGIGIARLRDAPVEWSRQHAMLGLTS